MFTIRLLINSVIVEVKVIATTIFSAMSQAEREYGGKAVGGCKGQGAVEFAAILAAMIVVAIAAYVIITPALGVGVDSTRAVGECLQTLTQEACK